MFGKKKNSKHSGEMVVRETRETRETIIYTIDPNASVSRQTRQAQEAIERAKETRNSKPLVHSFGKDLTSSEERKERAKEEKWQKELENYICWYYNQDPEKFLKIFRFRVKKELDGRKDFSFGIDFFNISRTAEDEAEEVKKERKKAKNQFLLYTKLDMESTIEKRRVTLPPKWRDTNSSFPDILQLETTMVEEDFPLVEQKEFSEKISSKTIIWRKYCSF